MSPPRDLAKPIEHTEFQDEFSETINDFCEVSGLTVHVDHVADGRFLFNPHGPDGLAYAHANLSFTNVYANMANDNTVTEVGRAVDKDLRVTDNGDGTLTILRLTTGPAAVYGPDGKVLARNPGQVRFEFLVDHGGTPTDPSDDEFLEDLGLGEGIDRQDRRLLRGGRPGARRLTNGTRCLSSAWPRMFAAWNWS
jgi:hypothetical protein